MATTQMYTGIILIIAFTVTATAATGLKEVCQWETFEAKCQEDEVIMITEAHYGRMGVGRCQPRDFGFAGCSADVSAIMHARCSGRQHCSIPVPDPIMFAATPCPKDLVTYLQADYKCVKVARSNTDNCDDQLLTAESGDIAKPLSHRKKSVCPHSILAQPGQTVNVYLYDFYNKDSNTEPMSECTIYGYISEDGNTPMKICGGEFKKNHLLYSSDSNVVDIMLIEGSSHSQHYLLHYEVVGCPTIQAPPNAFVKIEDNTVVIICNFSYVASKLVCSGNDWIGDIQNCTAVETDLLMAASLSITSIKNAVANSGVLAVICVGMICGLLFGIGLLVLSKARLSKANQISELPQISLLEKAALLPITMTNNGQHAPVHQNNLYEVPRQNALSVLRGTHHLLIDNTYGPLGGNRVAPINARNHSIYNITGLRLDQVNAITMDNSPLC